MNLKYPSLILIGIIAVVVIVMVTCITVGVWQHQAEEKAIDTLRQNVFCQLLKPGMSFDEVRDVLSRYGPYAESRVDFPGLYRVSIQYTDANTNRQFGGSITLTFINGGYRGAEVMAGIGEMKGVCKVPITPTPQP